MKQLLILILFWGVANHLLAQDLVHLSGVVEKPIVNQTVGDTITVYAIKENFNSGRERYMVRGTEGFTFYNSDRIRILEGELSFWEEIWMRNRAEEVYKNGWERELRADIREDATDYFIQAQSSNMIFEDDMLYDYLYQLIHRIHPYPLLKETASNFSVLVLTSMEERIFSFDNGMIILTTGYLASLSSEKELTEALAVAIAHTNLEHNLVNLKYEIRAERRARIWGTVAATAASVALAFDQNQNDVFFNSMVAQDFGRSVYFLADEILKNIGAKYDQEQMNEAERVGLYYMNSAYEGEKLDSRSYLSLTANAISFAAMQEYVVKNYHYAHQLLLKLEELDIATDRDYLLLSQIQRKLSNSPESDDIALYYLKKAKGKSLSPLIEIDKEMALVFSRMGNHQKTEEALLNYRENLLEKRKDGINVKKELDRVEQVLQRKSFQIMPLSENDDQYESSSSH
ncbi:hypothetical protein [Pleomorphovibrio marinus]|uniref:hypothetical protein n=1 Tax=Pleomorphovibrio marinus TaxID=2164132 RepID=UPI000E0C0602|nr:hypothetical protein [Pleomorphovibrio marinus]